MPLDELGGLRARLDGLDDDLLALVSRRLELASEIGRVKRESGLPDRDAGREGDVLARARAVATRLGLAPDMAASLLRLLVQASLQVQEHERVVAEGAGAGRSALVIGGAGRMGRWFVRFLASQGFRVAVADPAGAVAGFEHVADWRRADTDSDVVVVTPPLAATEDVLRELAPRRPRGLVFDVGSLKSPLRDALHGLAAAGVRVTSVHPMFGPDVELLSGRHVILVDVGVPQATAEARALFAATMADVVDMTLDEHDRLIGYVLGLSHAVNIAFFTTIAESGLDVERLSRISSTTFDAQLDVSSRVARENPRLYFEIQRLNAHGREPLRGLRAAVQAVVAAVENGDERGFVRLMERGRAYVEGVRTRRAGAGG